MTLRSVADRAPKPDAATPPRTPARRGLRRAVLAVVCAVAVAVPVAVVALRHDSPVTTPSTALPVTQARLAELTTRPYVLFRSTRVDTDYGRVTIAPAVDPSARRFTSSMACDRVDFAAGRGICLTHTLPGAAGDSGVRVFDATLRTTATIPLAGFPSRARVSPDGKYGAVTVFARGDTYATLGTFSTRTEIIDLVAGRVVLPLEQLRVTKDGHSFRRVDFNFWGVTFAADGDNFYATLGTGGHTYLIHGVRSTRTATVIADGVECPALSPDGTRIAFKQRDAGSTVSWHLAVMDLSTLAKHRLATSRDVDDQPMWLDNATVAYGQVDNGPGGGNPTLLGLSRLVAGGTVATTTWAVPADGSGTPRRLLEGAWSVRVVTP